MAKLSKSLIEDLPWFEPKDRDEWREWLRRNHKTAAGVWLVYRKKNSGGGRSLTYSEAVDEVLCFGWIDSVVRTLDETRYRQLITPRKPKSVWSALNKRKIEALIAEGRMTPAGMAKIEAAKADGSWMALDAVEALEVPPDLEQAFAQDEAVRAGFVGYPKSVRKQLLGWLSSAKRAETRATRLARIVAMCRTGERPRI